MDNNKVYYTIINKKDLSFINKKDNERLDKTMSLYVLDIMLKLFNIDKKEICYQDLGKPYFKDSDIFFNYSHSDNYIALAISKKEIGIDIEDTSKIVNESMIRVSNLDKTNSLEELVIREANTKLTGKGISEFFNKDNFNNINYKLIKTNSYICSINTYDKTNYEYINIKDYINLI